MTTDPITKGKAAERELTQTQAAFEKIRADYMLQIIATEAGETDKREALYHAIKGLELIRTELVRVAANGTVQQWVDDLG